MDYPIEKRTLGHILEDKTKKNGDKTFFHFEDKTFSYNETNKYANQLANGYMSLGLKKGDKVTVMMPNNAEFVFNWFGLSKLGGVDAPINTAYKGDLLRHVIRISDTRVILIHEDFVERLIPIQDDLTSVEKVVIYSPSGKKPRPSWRHRHTRLPRTAPGPPMPPRCPLRPSSSLRPRRPLEAPG